MPTFIGCETLRRQADLRGHSQLELVVRDLQEREQFPDEDPDVLLVDQRVRQLERAPTNGDIAVAQTVEDDVAMPLNCVRIDRDDLVQGVERDISGANTG